MHITAEDISWVQEMYPRLKFSESSEYQELTGQLDFCMAYDSQTNFRAILSNENYPKGEVICDTYSIHIEFLKTCYLPRVKETEGRIEKVKKENKVEDIRDLHITSEGFACLCSKLEEPKRIPEGSSLKTFFYELLIPFFYAQSYYEKFKQFPWGYYNHGLLGLMESYYALESQIDQKLSLDCALSICACKEEERASYINLLKQKERIAGHFRCVCNSGKVFRDCHLEAGRGLRHLQNDLKRFSLDIDDLLNKLEQFQNKERLQK